MGDARRSGFSRAAGPAMPIQFFCPAGHTLKVGSRKSGQAVECPVCGQSVVVPQAAPTMGEQTLGGNEATFIKLPANATAMAAKPPLRAALPPVKKPPRVPPKSRAKEIPPVQQAADAIPAIAPSTVKPPPMNVGPLQVAVAARGPRTVRGYKADEGKRLTVYYLAAGLAVLSLFTMLPTLIGGHLGLGEAHTWARLLLFLSLLQLAYAAWMVSIPDWSTLWTTMLFTATVATLYGMALAVVMGKPELLEIEMHAAGKAAMWCGMVILLLLTMTYLCGRAAHRWHRHFSLALARK